MRCDCGYSFAEHALEDPRPYKSYLVVDDADYPDFLDSEIEARRYRSDRAKLAALGRSAQFAGTMYECPECGTFILTKPGDFEREVLVRDTKRVSTANIE